MTSPFQQTTMMRSTKTLSTVPDFVPRTPGAGQGRSEEGFGDILGSVRADAFEGAPKSHGPMAAGPQHPPLDSQRSRQHAEAAEAAPQAHRRADTDSHSRQSAETGPRDGQASLHQDGEGPEDPHEEVKTEPAIQDGEAVSLAAQSVQPNQDQSKVLEQTEASVEGLAETVEGSCAADFAASSAPNGLEMAGVQTAKRQASRPEIEPGPAPASPTPEPLVAAQQGKVELDRLDNEDRPEDKDAGGLSALLAKATAALEQHERKDSGPIASNSPSPQASSVERDLPVAGVTSETHQWNSSETLGGDSSKQFEFAEQTDRSKGPVDQVATSAPPTTFTNNLVAVGANGTSSQASVNGEVRGLSVPAPPAPVRQPEEAPAMPQTFKSVTVDLDPLDLGPLRVRVMMTEQTVHAHIRTEHGALGQGLLQEGHQLESSLRTTGLEMGYLRVTVDQQQQGRGDSGSAYQQPGQPAGHIPRPAKLVSDEGTTAITQRDVYDGRVSFFA